MSQLTFLLDVDGVLTTGQFLYSLEGKTHKIFGAHDNDGLKMLKDKVKIRFITADRRGYPITKKRIVDDMGFQLDLVSEEDRYEYIKKKFSLSEVIYMGDGYCDVQIIRDCRFGIAPANARKEARAVADFITESKAGEGAVLDACLEILEKFIKET